MKNPIEEKCILANWIRVAVFGMHEQPNEAKGLASILKSYNSIVNTFWLVAREAKLKEKQNFGKGTSDWIQVQGNTRKLSGAG